MDFGGSLGVLDPRNRYSLDQSSKASPRPPATGAGPAGGAGGGGSVCPCIVPRSTLLGSVSTSAAAASKGLTTPLSTAPGAPRGLAAAVRPVGSAAVGPAAPVVAQAAAPTPSPPTQGAEPCWAGSPVQPSIFPLCVMSKSPGTEGRGVHGYLGLWGKARGLWRGGGGHEDWRAEAPSSDLSCRLHSTSILSSEDPHLEGSTL